jgi:hypothetical protein
MNTVLRGLVIAALLGWSVFRVVRYFRFGLAKSVTAVPPSAGILAPNTEGVSVASDSPTTATARSVRAGVTVVIVWVAANAVLGLLLFGLPMLAKVPLIWRLFVAVFANFYLYPFARRLGEKTLNRP